ncbi:hypothetical protein V4890_22055 [Ralstonia solanacearum species complex bacterium KE056]|uniref:hypothetical protein n=1 Tax=Ralstonia solanacearum species complex bacterium KE056 TaxID=3119585 RepID=UPI002FC3D7AD
MTAIASIAISMIAWTMDLTGLIYECPYCRVQRTAIGIVGLMMLTPFVKSIVVNWSARSVAGLGFVVAAQMHFLMIKDVLDGKMEDALMAIWENGLFLSAGAMLILTAQLMLLSIVFKTRPLPRFLQPST